MATDKREPLNEGQDPLWAPGSTEDQLERSDDFFAAYGLFSAKLLLWMLVGAVTLMSVKALHDFLF
ncbi:hypothetical protein I6B53_00660 [Schaalia sp. 19OD2882]|uniref:hypothetical protein n=1 Tax=Schaalia sp. 19OD2882 TaxID=2794089 RepID=UPI001C1EDB6E|nr:hypothetical protein [Schaalia sp. 19OD2882]QWW19689.1 hypothetical protein I6B53_00660 [Schaalia sp. 19OD2882]